MKKNHTYTSYILVFWPHPDDVEVGAGGVIAQSSAQGKKNVIIDLTLSQLSTHGDIATRQQEAQEAARVLWVTERKNLELHDGQLSASDDHIVTLLVEQIRQYAPEIILFPAEKDRHPDHEATHQLVKKALFFAGLAKYAWSTLSPHKARLMLCYQIWHEITPDVTIALSDEYFTAKMKAFDSYHSQEQTNARGKEYLTARHITQWRRIWARYGEWFITPCHGVGVTSLDELMSGCF